jgi:hypothetical protein
MARARRASLALVMSRLSHMVIALVERGKLGLWRIISTPARLGSLFRALSNAKAREG